MSSSSSPVLRKPSLSCLPSPTPSCRPPFPEMPRACPGPLLWNAQEPGQGSGSPQPTVSPRGEGGNLYLCSQNPATGCHLPAPHVPTASSFQEFRRWAPVQAFPRLHGLLAMSPERKGATMTLTRPARQGPGVLRRDPEGGAVTGEQHTHSSSLVRSCGRRWFLSPIKSPTVTSSWS